MLTEGTSIMTISLDRRIYKICDAKKTRGGQFNTKRNDWLKPQIIDFIKNAGVENYLDPFAGNGDIFKALKGLGLNVNAFGYDLDPDYNWPINDSLKEVPAIKNSMVVTNPPYLAKHSAKRKGVKDSVSVYYSESGYDDLYLIAMESCMAASEKCVFIIPETYINSDVKFPGVVSISVILDTVFDDTENPVCVVCYERGFMGETDIYIDDKFIGKKSDIDKMRIKPTKTIPIKFNVPDGSIGFRAVDMPSPEKKIAFMPAGKLGYNSKNIKVSSRLVTYIKVNGLQESLTPEFCRVANETLNKSGTSGKAGGL
jgi:hypothetical protein